MLVLAPDPRLGIAPERVARLRALLDAAATEAPVPGVVVALPGGADGVLDAVVVRPDGVLGLAPLPAGEREAARESVAAGGGRLDTPPTGTGRGAPGSTAAAVAEELDRL
ncbi:MAG TPA: hypothetical protein VK935_02870, partial [Actinomycetospora sp.]|nr:hypothetical protein [Actinomycetospora sp.]